MLILQMKFKKKKREAITNLKYRENFFVKIK